MHSVSVELCVLHVYVLHATHAAAEAMIRPDQTVATAGDYNHTNSSMALFLLTYIRLAGYH
jgi:hypothetical protein